MVVKKVKLANIPFFSDQLFGYSCKQNSFDEVRKKHLEVISRVNAMYKTSELKKAEKQAVRFGAGFYYNTIFMP